MDMTSKSFETDIDPDQQVKEAMNRINAAEREKVALSMVMPHVF